MRQAKEFREMCKEVQKEFPHLTIDKVEEIIRHQFLFAQTHISEGSLIPIYFQYLGRFRVKPGKIEWLKKNRKKRNDTNIECKLQSKRDTSSSPEE